MENLRDYKKFCLIQASGIGSRFKSNIPKQFVEVCGKPILMYCVDTIQQMNIFDEIVVLVSKEYIDYTKSITNGITIIEGGDCINKTRWNGIKYFYEKYLKGLLCVFDGVRPLVSSKLISECIEKTILTRKQTITYTYEKDAVLMIDENNKLTNKIIDQHKLLKTQTPICFILKDVYDVYNKHKEELDKMNGMYEFFDNFQDKFELIYGEENNFKITTPDDEQLMISYLKQLKEV